LSDKLSLVEKQLPMLVNKDISVDDLLYVSEIVKKEESVLGLHLPVVENVNFDQKEYSFFNTIHWLDDYLGYLKDYIILKLQLENQKERLKIISKAVLKITQRVNLFEKVLIPTAGDNIKKIKIAISDDERSAVVRSKLAKAMHEKQHIEESQKK